MKTFADVQSWLSSNPSKEEIEKVLKVINRSAQSSMRREFHQKNAELKKMKKVIDSLGEVNLPVSKEVKDQVVNLQKEVEELQKQLPVIQKKVKKTE